MMKALTFFCLFFISIYPNFSQDWEAKFNKEHINVLELEKEFMEYWSQRDLEQAGGEYKQYARMLHSMKKRINSKGYLKDATGIEELVDLHRRNKAVVQQHKNMIEPWTLLGPENSPAANHYHVNKQGVGRMTSIAWHPDRRNRIVAGASTGGIWISDNMGEDWYGANDDFLPNLGISNIVYSPDDGDILYAGTGGNRINSYGLLRSVDGGNNWNLTNFTSAGYPHRKIYDIIVHPENASNVIVSTNSGTFQSLTGGLTWTSISNLTFQHMHYSKKNIERIYAVSYLEDNAGFYNYETNSGIWTRTFNFQSSSSKSRIGISAANLNLVYVWEEYREEGDVINKLYKSNNEGASFNYVSTIPSNVFYSYGPGFRSMAVDQSDPDFIFIGAVHMAKSLDGGQTWGSISCDEENCVHVDHWDAHFFGDNKDLFLATDGGIWSTPDYGETWRAHNSGLEVTQFYRISVAETDPYITLGGSQDNGSMIYDKGWTFVGVGDGMDNAIDPSDHNNFYYSLQGGVFNYTYDGAETRGALISNSITGIQGQWITPIALDKQNPNTLYVGYDRVWKSTDKGQNWTDFDHPSICSSTFSCIEYLDISTSNPNYVYAVAGSNIYRSTNAGETWNKRNTNYVYANWIEIDPKNENRLWITGSGSIQESNDGGITWVDIKGDLPNNIDFTAIVCDEETNDHLYVGTESAGIYFKDASMTNWMPYDMNLPKVIISDLEIVENYKILRAGTWGRGVWQTFTMDYRFCDDALNISNVIEEGVHQAIVKIQSDGTTREGSTVKFSAMENIDLLPNFEIKETTSFEAMIDSCVSLIPPILSEGFNCDQPFVISGNGTIAAPGPAYGNGSYGNNRHAVWYSYTAPGEGTISVNSCGEKTRLILWNGTCSSVNADLNLIARSSLQDYDCTGSTSNGSKLENVPVSSGDQILLEWDNRHSKLPFEFTFQFNPIASTITVLDPTSSTMLEQGQSYTYRWTSSGPIGNVKVELLKGGSLVHPHTTNTANDGIHQFAIPVSLPYGNDYRVKISERNGSIFGVSNLFTIGKEIIIDAMIEFNYPTAEIEFSKGATLNIQWVDNIPERLILSLYKKNSNVPTLISNNIPEDESSYIYTFPTNLEAGLYKFRLVWNEDGITQLGVNSDYFLIKD